MNGYGQILGHRRRIAGTLVVIFISADIGSASGRARLAVIIVIADIKGVPAGLVNGH